MTSPSSGSVLIQSAHHSAQLVEAVRKDILTKQMHFQPDLTIVCAGGGEGPNISVCTLHV